MNCLTKDCFQKLDPCVEPIVPNSCTEQSESELENTDTSTNIYPEVSRENEGIVYTADVDSIKKNTTVTSENVSFKEENKSYILLEIDTKPVENEKEID